jgi:hypothetical protein
LSCFTEVTSPEYSVAARREEGEGDRKTTRKSEE